VVPPAAWGGGGDVRAIIARRAPAARRRRRIAGGDSLISRGCASMLRNGETARFRSPPHAGDLAADLIRGPRSLAGEILTSEATAGKPPAGFAGAERPRSVAFSASKCVCEARSGQVDTS